MRGSAGENVRSVFAMNYPERDGSSAINVIRLVFALKRVIDITHRIRVYSSLEQKVNV